jgi:AcrR family transcriptional regulator
MPLEIIVVKDKIDAVNIGEKMSTKDQAAGTGAGLRRPYHHGSLREALLEAGERILDRDGINALTLRAVAREAGASHAAPKNHFNDLAALLSELAAVGFKRFAAGLAEAAKAAPSPGDQPAAVGKAYVRFASEHPGLFLLMFRSERLDMANPALREAMDEAGAMLARASSVSSDGMHSGKLGVKEAARMVSAWSLVHGFAMLLIDGRLGGLLSEVAGGVDADALLDEVLSGRG